MPGHAALHARVGDEVFHAVRVAAVEAEVCRPVKGVIHVPRQQHHAAIAGAREELDVVREILVVGVGEAGERVERERARPAFEIERGVARGVEAGVRSAERSGHRDDAGEVVARRVVLHEVVETIRLLVRAHRRDVHGEEGRVGVFETLRVPVHGGRRVVDDLLLEERAVAAIRREIIERGIAVAAQAELRAAALVVGRLDVAHVVEFRWDAARALGDALEKQLVHARAE